MDDAELVTAALEGSVSAFSAIFDRHAGRVHDLALAVLRDRSLAIEVVEATFQEARERLADLADERRLQVWLLAIARRQAVLRAGGTAAGDRQPLPSDDDPERVRLASVVWEAVADLPLLDRTLLDLELRQGLAGPDLADALGVPGARTPDLERRLQAIDVDLSSHLVASDNHRHCRGLTRLLKGWDGRSALQHPRRVSSHIAGCRVCTQASATLPPPLALYAAAPAAPFPSAARRPAPVLVLKLLPDPAPDAEVDPAREPWPPAATDAASSLDGEAAARGDGEGPQGGREAWMTDGFPPPSFPPLSAPTPEGTLRRSSGGRRGHGRRRVAAALVGAALLLGVALVALNRDDEKTALRLDSTTTSVVPDTTFLPEATTLPVEPSAPPVPPDPSTTGPGDATTAVAPSAASTPPRPGAPPGVLLASLETLRIPTVDQATGPQRGSLPLRNTGASPLSYAMRSSFAGLTVDKPTGTINPGAEIALIVTLDGAKAKEGPFTATLTFEGSGGTQQVNVASKVGRRPVIRDDAGEACTTAGNPCSKAVQLVPGPSPSAVPTLCNTPWRYSVHVDDESQLKVVQADANLADRDAQLRRVGAPGGTGGLWQSGVFAPLPVATSLDVTIQAVDEFDFTSVRTERGIAC